MLKSFVYSDRNSALSSFRLRFFDKLLAYLSDLGKSNQVKLSIILGWWRNQISLWLNEQRSLLTFKQINALRRSMNCIPCISVEGKSYYCNIHFCPWCYVRRAHSSFNKIKTLITESAYKDIACLSMKMVIYRNEGSSAPVLVEGNSTRRGFFLVLPDKYVYDDDGVILGVSWRLGLFSTEENLTPISAYLHNLGVSNKIVTLSLEDINSLLLSILNYPDIYFRYRQSVNLFYERFPYGSKLPWVNLCSDIASEPFLLNLRKPSLPAS